MPGGSDRLLPSGLQQGIYRATTGSASNEANGRIELADLPRALDWVRSPCGRVARTAVYLVRAGKVIPVLRGPAGRDPRLAVFQLFRGPTRRDRGAGFETSIPARALRDVQIADGVATVHVTRAFPIVASARAHLAHAQLVYTLTRYSHIRAVRVLVGGKPTRVSVSGAPATIAPPVPRRNFAATAPRILVESPVAHQAIESPLCVRGNAVASGGSIEIELQDPRGRVLARGVARLAAGSRGSRRSFSTTLRYRGVAARLLVFGRAADGSRQNLVSVQLAGR